LDPPTNQSLEEDFTMKNWTKHLVPNVGTLLVVGLLLLVQSVAARPALEQELQALATARGIDSPSATLFSYQGQLLDAAGDPVAGSADMTFRLYHQETDGTAFWTEAHTGGNAVSVSNGLFHVLLGSLVPIDPADLTADVYLELEVNGETLAPRELFTSVVYAVEAGTLPDGAVTRGSLTVDGNLQAIGRVLGAKDATLTEFTEVWHGGSNGFINTVGDGNLDFRHDNNTLMSLTDTGDVTVVSEVTVDGNGTSKIEGNLQVGDNGWMPSYAGMDGNDMAVHGAFEQNGSGGARFYRVGVGRDPVSGEGSLAVSSKVEIGNQGSIAAKTDSGGQGPHMVFETGDVFVFETDAGRLRISSNSNGTSFDGTSWFYFDNYLVPNANKQYDLGSVERHWRTAYLQTASCGALLESNLQTEEEQKAGRIDRFEEGDLLCWSPEAERLELCSAANDRLVQAVADDLGRPIVIGAELVKVIGPVKAGDFLVSSDLPGYAMASADPSFGTVIAQALEDFDGERGLVKAMIRKM
jgi:hypothetical protein